MQQLSSKNRLSISNFTFERLETGQYLVKFYSTKTNKESMNIVNDMVLIQKTNLTYCPKQKDLITLKKLCKNGNN